MKTLVLAFLVFLGGVLGAQAELKLALPLGRTAYQDNEWIALQTPSPRPTGRRTATMLGRKFMGLKRELPRGILTLLSPHRMGRA